MKLLTKTNKYYLIFLVFLSPFMIAVDYYLIEYLVNNEVNDILQRESERLKYYLNETDSLPSSNYLIDINPVGEDARLSEQFSDTLIYEAYADQLIPYRSYEFTSEIEGERVRVSVKHILIEINELILWLFASTTLILLVLVTGLYFIKKRISKWAWEPFFNNLSKLKNYDLSKKNFVQLEPSGISEFEELNRVITSLMNQVKKDFLKLKEFNENISHEMQTPLAIIRNKMVLLLESQNLDEKELQWVESAYQEANKLSKIGKSLTLISRIENQEFAKLNNVDARAIVDNIIINMEEVINFKDLEMIAELKPVKVKCDPILANILFTNLIKNAVQHNRKGGYIKMMLDEEKFEIENPGEVLQTETTKMFNRFQKGDTQTDSLGLGLAINQKICEISGFRLEYEHFEGKHTFSLYFPGSVTNQ